MPALKALKRHDGKESSGLNNLQLQTLNPKYLFGVELVLNSML